MPSTKFGGVSRQVGNPAMWSLPPSSPPISRGETAFDAVEIDDLANVEVCPCDNDMGQNWGKEAYLCVDLVGNFKDTMICLHILYTYII